MTKSGSSCLAIGELAAHVADDQVGNEDRLARHLELDRAFVFVGQAVREQRLDAALVVFLALALEIGAAIAFARAGGVAGERAFVPVQPEPAQAVEDDVHGFLRVARGVGVLDAQDERAAGVAGVKPVEQGRARAADVQEAGRAGGKTNARFHGYSFPSYSTQNYSRTTIVAPHPCWQDEGRNRDRQARTRPFILRSPERPGLLQRSADTHDHRTRHGAGKTGRGNLWAALCGRAVIVASWPWHALVDPAGQRADGGKLVCGTDLVDTEGSCKPARGPAFPRRTVAAGSLGHSGLTRDLLSWAAVCSAGMADFYTKATEARTRSRNGGGKNVNRTMVCPRAGSENIRTPG